MPTLHCTQRVLKRFRLRPDTTSSEPQSGRLGHWYANLLNVGRERWVLCVSERSLLPVMLPARNDLFPSALANYLRDVLLELGIDESLVADEIRRTNPLVVTTTGNRQVLGVMNDFAVHASLYLRDGLPPGVVALRLAEVPSKPLGHDSAERATRSLFEDAQSGADWQRC